MQWKDSAPGTEKNIASGSVTGATTAVVPVAVIDLTVSAYLKAF